MQLYSFIGLRYGNAFQTIYSSELPFLETVKRGLDAIDVEKALMSNELIKKYLKPCLEKAMDRIEKIVKSSKSREK